MTEPDKALLWARENRVTRLEPTPYCNEVPHIRLGVYDQQLLAEAHAYRAGAAASAERIKELEARVKELEAALKPLAQCEIPGECPRLPDDHGCRYYFSFGEIRRARAALNEPRND